MAACGGRQKGEMNCREVENKLSSYVDGAANGNAAAIAAHLETCDACRRAAHAQTVARTVLKARAAQLSPTAPPGLRTRIVANLESQDLKASRRQGLIPSLAWTGRLTAFAAAAMVVLTLGAVLLPAATIRSTTLLAAQLALDHLKCFTIEGDADGAPIAKAQAETTLKQDFDLIVKVPASLAAEKLELLAVRRCLYGDGRAAHLMYRLDGEPVSLFVVPGLTRPTAELSLFGHEQVVWTQGDRTYMLVARGGSRDRLARVASYLRNEAQ
jgi:anti-sigma factor RsiW